MRGIAVGVGVGFLLGAIVTWLVSDSASAGSAISGEDIATLAEISDRCGRVEARLDAVAEQLQRLVSAPISGSDVSRSEVAEVRPTADLSKELDRLKVEIERLTASAKSGVVTMLTVEDLRRDKNPPPNWVELEKLNSANACEGIKFSTADEIVRCFGRPSWISAGEHGAWWYYSREDPKCTWAFQLLEGRVVVTLYSPGR